MHHADFHFCFTDLLEVPGRDAQERQMLWRMYERLRYWTIAVLTAPFLAIAWVILKLMDAHRSHLIRTKFKGDASAYERARWREEL